MSWGAVACPKQDGAVSGEPILRTRRLWGGVGDEFLGAVILGTCGVNFGLICLVREWCDVLSARHMRLVSAMVM